MKPELRDRKENFLMHFIKSAKYSIEGLIVAFKSEKSFHLLAICFGIFLIISIVFKLNWLDFLILLICFLFILVVELLNTAIEKTVDLVTLEYHKLAKMAKDCGSAATFITILIALIISFIVLYPYI